MIDSIWVVLGIVIVSLIISIVFTYISKKLLNINRVKILNMDNLLPNKKSLSKLQDVNLNIFNVPYPRNRNFTGRDGLLSNLHANFMSSDYSGMTQALTGLGGVGKTQIALEYIYRYKNEYNVIWWMKSGDAISIAKEYANLSNELNLPEHVTADQTVIIKAVKRWLERNKRWLLVFDNIKNPDDLKDFLPKSGGGNIIITSRNPNWGNIANVTIVNVFQRNESIKFLLKRTAQDNKEKGDEVADALGDLPLALEQAGAYIEISKISFLEYLNIFNTRRSEILNRGKPLLYAETVATTWELSFREIERNSPEGSDLLKLFAFLSSEEIPSFLLFEGADYLPENLAALSKDELKFNDVLINLRRYSLVNISANCFSIHRLVQAVTRSNMTEVDQEKWVKIALKLIAKAFPEDIDNAKFWPKYSLLLPHAVAAIEYATSFEICNEDLGILYFRMGGYLRVRVMFKESKTNFENAIRVYEKLEGSENVKIAASLANLGIIYSDIGELIPAKNNLEKSLRIYDLIYGPEHQDVARVTSSLGLVLRALGDLEAAKAKIERSLEIDEKIFGPNHPNIAIDANNLGLVYRDQGNFSKAKFYFERAMEINLDTYGEFSPFVATIANNLGDAQIAQNDLIGAKNNLEIALRIDKKTYGPDHPFVAIDLNNLAYILQMQGNLEDAQEYYEKALEIDMKSYGNKHPNIATDLNNLANVLQSRGEINRAKELLEKAIEIDKSIYGSNHPSIARDLDSIGLILHKQRNLEEAKRQFEISLKIFKDNLYRDTHPDVESVKRHLNALDNERRPDTP